MAKLRIEGVGPSDSGEQVSQAEDATGASVASAKPSPDVPAQEEPAASAKGPAPTPKASEPARPAAPARPRRPRIVSETPSESASASAPPEASRMEPVRPALPKALAWIERVFPGHVNAVLGGFAGLICALMVFVIGFWQTLFVCLLVVAGVAVGQVLDGDPKIFNRLRALLADERGDEQG